MGEFGEKHRHGLYLPMSDLESEALMRLWEHREYKLYEKVWGEVDITNVIVGDKRIGIRFRIGPKCFESLEVARPITFFNLELWAKGRLLFQKELSTLYNGEYLMVSRGFFADLQLDIAIDKINPDLVKEVIQAVGLTSRRGNEKFTTQQKILIQSLKQGEQKVARIQKENLDKAKAKR